MIDLTMEDKQFMEEIDYLNNYFRQRELTRHEACSAMMMNLIFQTIVFSEKQEILDLFGGCWDYIYSKNKEQILAQKLMKNE